MFYRLDMSFFLALIIVVDLRSVSTTRVHGQSSRAELTARELGCIFDTRQLEPWTRVVETGRPCTRAVYTTRVVETDLYALYVY